QTDQPADNRQKTPEAIRQDCFGCKVIGTGTFLGCATYATYHYFQTPAYKVNDRRFLVGMAVIFSGLSIARAIS
ncbi:unnamed protein product, partial [Heterosigma akashiwo]